MLIKGGKQRQKRVQRLEEMRGEIKAYTEKLR
jgi:hypothetical protein